MPGRRLFALASLVLLVGSTPDPYSEVHVVSAAHWPAPGCLEDRCFTTCDLFGWMPVRVRVTRRGAPLTLVLATKEEGVGSSKLPQVSR